jgi:integrase
MPRTTTDLPPYTYLKTDGRYELRFPIGKLEGKYQYITKYTRTLEEAWTIYSQINADHSRGKLSAPSTITVQEWINRQLGRKRTLRPSSQTENARIAGKITQTLGGYRLQQLTATDIEDWIDRLDLSQRTRKKALGMLRKALDRAVAADIIPKNPAFTVELDRVPQVKVGKAYTLEQARALIEQAQTRRIYALYALMLCMGLRPGEAMALRLEDYDPTKGTLRIERTATQHGHVAHAISDGTKTPAGIRTLYLPKDLQAVLNDSLNRRESERSELGAGWHEEGFLIPADNGNMLMHTNIRRDYNWIIEAYNYPQGKAADPRPEPHQIPTYRLYDLRHTWNTHADRIGIREAVRMRILGQQLTGNVNDFYNHTFEGELLEARERLEGLFLKPYKH